MCVKLGLGFLALQQHLGPELSSVYINGIYLLPSCTSWGERTLVAAVPID